MLVKVEDVSERVFDYIIIGGGTSGLCLAARLSEDASVSVLVLEAGEANLRDPALLLPAAYGSHFGNPKYDWAFNSVKQPNCADREIFWPRGKGLGGSSAINFMLWNKPSKQDVDALEALGNPGWNWENFQKYTKKAEGFSEPEEDKDILTYDLNMHGSGGPVKTVFPKLISGLERPMQESFRKLGVQRVVEPAGGYLKGAGTFMLPSSIDPETFTRSYSVTAYYTPNANRNNLAVLVSAHVAEITTTPNADGSVTATGVKFLHGEATHVVKCGREVLLSAGSINSPQILELSGIGNKDILQKVGIDVKVDLPGVGENLQDHYYGGVTYELTDEAASIYHTLDPLRDPEQGPKELALHAEKKGLHTSGFAGVTLLPLKDISPDANKLQAALRETIMANMHSGKYPQGLKKQYKLQLDHIQGNWPSAEIICASAFLSRPKPPAPGKKYLTLCPALNHPFSRGSIHIVSNDPTVPPAIDPGTFNESYDLTTFVEIVKFIRKAVKEDPLRGILTGLELNPGKEYQSDEQIADYIRQTVDTTYHTIGSASMLPLEDGGVVNAKLKVYRTTNIRVVDTSICPLHIGSHTQALAYAIAEQAADIIKGKL